MKSFGEFFSYVDFVRVISYDDFHPRPNVPSNDPAISAWYDLHQAFWKAQCSGPLTLWLTQLFVDKVFQAIPNHCDREDHVSYAWDQSLDRELHDLVYRSFAKCLRYELMIAAHRDAIFPVKYQALIASMDSGNYPWYTTDFSSKCQRTGNSIWLDIQDWVPFWGNNDSSGSSSTGNFAICAMLEPDPGYREFEIDIPSGRLLMNDWFRIAGFREAVDTKEFTIDTAWSHNERVKHYASQGWVLLPSGNCTVHVFSPTEEDTSHLVFNMNDGSWWDNETDTEHYDITAVDQGSICCDMWAVGVIDYQVLHGLLQSRHGDKTDAAIEEWIDTEMEGFELDVEPGRYRISYGLRDMDFLDIARERGIEVLGCHEPIFTMTKLA